MGERATLSEELKKILWLRTGSIAFTRVQKASDLGKIRYVFWIFSHVHVLSGSPWGAGQWADCRNN